MAKRNTAVRSLHLTQKGLTATCSVCGGVGAVLAYPIDPPHPEYEGEDEAVVGAVGALVPCPGCFSFTNREVRL